MLKDKIYVNIGADNIFKNSREMKRFFAKTFKTKDVKVKYDTNHRKRRS